MSPLERLTIQSFLDHGHEFILWTYDLNIKCPARATIRDANLIIPQKDVFRYAHVNQFGHGKGSYAGFSDIFRYKLLYEKGGIWVDMDVTCLKKFDFAQPYFFRAHHKNDLVGNIMKCPKHDPLMQYCYDRARKEITSNNVDWMLPLTILKQGIQQFELSAYILDISNEDSWPKVANMLKARQVLPADWYAIHWMNEEWRRLDISKKSYLAESSLGYLLKQHQVAHSLLSKKEIKTHFKKLSRLHYVYLSLMSKIKAIF